jgi:GDPmannose 4,6-dehydratase
VPKKQRVVITGVSGQDGSYLAELYLQDGWEVHGIVRRASSLNRKRLDQITENLSLADKSRLYIHYGDVLDFSSLIAILRDSKPSHVVNLAAQSHVGISFKLPVETNNVVALGALNVFEATRLTCPSARIYQASSSEMFGGLLGRKSLSESDFFQPKSPYANAKVAAHHYASIYRDAYEQFVVSGILFNHESPRRGENFVTRKITLTLGKILKGETKHLSLGNLTAKRDWGHAKDYVRAIRLMLNQESPQDFVVATGLAKSVYEFATDAFLLRGLDVNDFLVTDPNQFRPNEVADLVGDSSAIRLKLQWIPEYNYHDLVREMVDHDTSV